MHFLFRPFFLRPAKRFLITALPWKQNQLCCYHQSSCNLPNVKLKVVKAPPFIPITLAEKSAKLKRHLSPHLTIYKPQMSSGMSISVRMTGLTLAIMAWIVGLTVLISDHHVDFYVDKLKKLEFDDWVWTTAKTVMVWPFSFHFIGGLRHLCFDSGKMMEKQHFFATGVVAIILAVILTFLLGMEEQINQKLMELQKEEELDKKKK